VDFDFHPEGESRKLRFIMKTLAQSFLCSLVIAVATTTSLAAEKKTGVGPSFKGPIGLQLYSLRDAFAKDVPGTLDKVKAYGITEVELASLYNMPPEKLKEMLDARGLKPISGHFPFERYRDDAEGIARECKALGLKYAGCAWVPHKKDYTEADCREAIKVFNRAGETLAKSGVKFFYHAHGYEFQPYGDGTLLDLMMKEMKPEFANFQMDVLWMFFPGQDPVKLMQKYPGRWILMHLKDLKKGVARGELTGHTDVNNNVVLGTGQIDWPSVLKEAKKQGIKYYFIEDESASAAEQIPRTLKYLEQVKW